MFFFTVYIYERNIKKGEHIMDNEHLTKKQLAEYIDYTLYREGDCALCAENSLHESEIEKIEEHILHCDVCTDMARKIYKITLGIDSWNFSSHRRNLDRNRIINALQTSYSSAQNPEIKRRIELWLQMAIVRYGCHLKFLKDFQENVKFSRFYLDSFNSTNYSAAFAKNRVGFTRGTGENDDELEIENSRRVIINDFEKSREICISSVGSEIDVRIEFINFNSFNDTPLVILIPEYTPEKSIVAIPEYSEYSKKWYSEFKNIPNGKYLLLIEPDEKAGM